MPGWVRSLPVGFQSEAEIRDLDLSVATDQQILRLDVTVKRALVMNGLETARTFERDRRSDPPRQFRFDLKDERQVEAVDIFRRDVLMTAMMKPIVNTDHIGVMQSCGRHRLTFEASLKFRTRFEHRMDALQHGGAVEAFLASKHDHAHSARPEFALDHKSAELAPGEKAGAHASSSSTLQTRGPWGRSSVTYCISTSPSSIRSPCSRT